MASLMEKFALRAFGRPRGVLGRLGGHLMARMNRACTQQVLALLDLGPRDRVLEIGFGSGVGIALAARAAQSVAGADPSREMLAQAEARNAGEIGSGRVDLHLAPAEQLPFADGAFDKVFTINSMQVWHDRAAAMREIRRVLKADGRLALGFTPNSGQGKAGVVDTLTAAGFAQAKLVDIAAGFCALAVNPS